MGQSTYATRQSSSESGSDTPHVPLPVGLLFDPRVTPQAIRLYAILAAAATSPDTYRGSWRQLGVLTGTDRSTVKRAARVLKAAGWIAVDRAMGDTNTITVHHTVTGGSA